MFSGKMKIIVIAMTITLTLVSEVVAQQQAQQQSAQVKTYTITGTFEEITATLQQLGKLPWNDVNPLMQRFIAQMNAQNPLPNSPLNPSSNSVQEGESE